jgi:quercetin dioxygenase-like cupin family protein
MQLAWRGFDAHREEIEIVVQAGDTFENPVSGQQLTFHKTAGDTGGELLEVESVYTKPSPSRPPIHYHPRQEERFEVFSGELHTPIDGDERTLTEGEVLVIPPRIPHGMWSEEAGTRVNWQTRPALKTEAFFETLWGLARDGKTNDKGVPTWVNVHRQLHRQGLAAFWVWLSLASWCTSCCDGCAARVAGWAATVFIHPPQKQGHVSTPICQILYANHITPIVLAP